MSKEELAEYILAKEHIVKAYHIDRRWLYTDLDNFNTKRRGLLEKEEIAIFLATLDRLHHPEMNLVEANKSSTNGVGVESTHKIYTSNFKECLPLFESVFNAIDAKDDRIVKREELIESIYSDADCMSILDSIVLHILIIDKPISYRQILTCVLDDYRK